MAKFVHNHCPYSATRKFPFYLILGYEPQALPEITSTSSLPAVNKCLETLTLARNKALAAHELARQTMRSHIHSKFATFSINEFGSKPETLSENWLIQNLHPKEKDPFSSQRSYLLGLIN